MTIKFSWPFKKKSCNYNKKILMDIQKIELITSVF